MVSQKDFDITVRPVMSIPIDGNFDYCATASCYRCSDCDRVFPIFFSPGKILADEASCPDCNGKCRPDYDANTTVIKQYLFDSGELRYIWETFIIPSQKASSQPILKNLVETWPEKPKPRPVPLVKSPKKERKIDKPASLELRKQIWDRDGYTCQVCGLKISWECYECGHIIDKMVGGPTKPENLVVMCRVCNQRKPIHRTRGEYEDWLHSGYWVAEWISEAEEYFFEHRAALKEFAPNLFDISRERMIEIMEQEFRYRQMLDMGIIDRFPPSKQWDERRKNGLFPEWKNHQQTY